MNSAPPEGGATPRVVVAIRRGLGVFGGFVAVAVVFFVLTFGPFKTVHGIRTLPLPEWVMLVPTLATLGAGVVAGVIVVVVDLVRGRRARRGEGPQQGR